MHIIATLWHFVLLYFSNTSLQASRRIGASRWCPWLRQASHTDGHDAEIHRFYLLLLGEVTVSVAGLFIVRFNVFGTTTLLWCCTGSRGFTIAWFYSLKLDYKRFVFELTGINFLATNTLDSVINLIWIEFIHPLHLRALHTFLWWKFQSITQNSVDPSTHYSSTLAISQGKMIIHTGLEWCTTPVARCVIALCKQILPFHGVAGKPKQRPSAHFRNRKIRLNWRRSDNGLN